MKRLAWSGVAVAVLATAGGALLLRTPPDALVQWVAGPDFDRVLSQSVSHALKVDGKFGPMRLEDDWSVVAENFTSKGWPGQAIGALNTGRARGSFDVWGILRGEWHILNNWDNQIQRAGSLQRWWDWTFIRPRYDSYLLAMQMRRVSEQTDAALPASGGGARARE
jgi:hypothetical protein